METKDRKVYNQGQYANFIGLTERDNPYRGHSGASRDAYVWLAGWIAAEHLAASR